MIKTTQRYYDSVQRSILETNQLIARKPSPETISKYKKHIAALEKISQELEIVDYMTPTEGIEYANQFYFRVNELKNSL
jgi:hypothetical protein